MAYWGTEGLLKTKGNAAFRDLIDLAQNSAFTVETRAKAVKELSCCSFQLFDRELPEDPGEWEEIGDSGADPFCIDIQKPDSPVYHAEHGTGSWDFHVYADSFIDFLLNL